MLVTVDYSGILGNEIKNEIVKLLYLTSRCMIYHERSEMKAATWIEDVCSYVIKITATDVALYDNENCAKVRIHSYDDKCEMDSNWYNSIVNNNDLFVIECARIIINDAFVHVNGSVILEDYHKFNLDYIEKYGN